MSILVTLLAVSLLLRASGVINLTWLPSYRSWLKAFGLAIPTWFGCVAFISLDFWISLLLLPVVIYDPVVPSVTLLILPLIVVSFLAASLIWYLLLVYIYRLFLRLLSSEVPQVLHWLKPPKKKHDILWGWVTIVFAVLIGVVPLALPLFDYYYGAIYVSYFNNSTFITDLIVEAKSQMKLDRMIVGWYIAAAYLDHARSLFNARRNTQRQALNNIRTHL